MAYLLHAMLHSVFKSARPKPEGAVDKMLLGQEIPEAKFSKQLSEPEVFLVWGGPEVGGWRGEAG